MASQNTPKFVHSHAERKKKAEQLRQTLPMPVGFFDREALVEFLLLEELVNLYTYRLKLAEGRQYITGHGKKSGEANIIAFSALVKLFTTAMEVAESEIYSGNFKAVWSSIPEGALMRAAKSAGREHMSAMRTLATKMLKNLTEDAMFAAEQASLLDDDLEEVEIHENNVRRVKNLPSEAEINALIREVELAIPDIVKKPAANRNATPNV